MKTKLFAGIIAASFELFTSINLYAQDSTSVGQDLKNAAKKAGHEIKKGAKKVGNKTAELASKGKAGVVDKMYDGKKGPNGETIYIDNKSKYYWVDKKGHKNYITADELKDNNR